MDGDARTRDRLEQHWAASDRGDIDTEHAIYAADAILDYPQSGERFRGQSRIRAQLADPFQAPASRVALAEPIPGRDH